ncbi:MAG: stage III sporulation protein AB [Firmicutes bacterium]|nr:stage III sporulation protein AB [Bacillota bacterium]MBQ3199562.1 stage III sporulation protein AB [Bacillota bacterium]
MSALCVMFGALCVLVACLGVFGLVRLALKMRQTELQSWLSAVRLLSAEMNFGVLPLPRLCSLLGERVDGTAGCFFANLGDELGRQKQAALPQIWQELLVTERSGWHLSAADVSVLADLGAGLGKSGLANQRRLLALTEERLASLHDEAAARCERLYRLLGALGWCSGLLLVCLWL